MSKYSSESDSSRGNSHSQCSRMRGGYVFICVKVLHPHLIDMTHCLFLELGHVVCAIFAIIPCCIFS